MRKNIMIILLCINIVYANAQKNNFGFISYTVPAGYELMKTDNVLTYVKLDAKTGAYCRFMIYNMLPAQGSPQQNFDFFWNNMLKKSMSVTGEANMQPAATLKGWQLSMGTTIYEDNGMSTMAILSTFSGENKMQNICILCNADAYKNDIENFIASVDLTKEITTVESTDPSSTTPKVETNNSVSQADNSIAGIWTFSDRQMMAATYASLFTAISRGYKFNPDGTYWYYNKVYYRGNTNLLFRYETGTYTVSGNKLTIKPGKGQNEEWSKKGKDGDLLGEQWGTRLKTTARKLETITYTFKIGVPPDNRQILRLMLNYDKQTERDKGFTYIDNQWGYGNYETDPGTYPFPPGFIMSGGKNTSSSGLNTSSNSIQNTATQNVSNSKYDLWMAHKLNVGGSLAEMSFQYVVLSSDNRCLFYFPEKGLYNLEQDFPASSNSWGKVTDQGNKLVLNNDRYGKMELFKKTATAMARYADSKPGDFYKKCKPVDGIRIEGAYSPDVSLYKNKSTILDKIGYDPNKRPVIFFKKDGTYVNEGIAFSNLTFGDAFAIGRGTYELKDFSLILTTQSGRKLQTSFAGIQDANIANSSDGYIINNNLFYKLDNSFQPHQ